MSQSIGFPLVAGCYAPLVLLVLLALVGDGLEGGWPANPAACIVERHVRRRLWPQTIPAGLEVHP